MAKPKKIRPLASSPEFIKWLIIAEPGFGKTVTAGTAPKALFLTTDPEGTVSAKRRGSTAEEWRIESWDDIVEAHRYLRDEGIPTGEYKWVIIDNITEAQAFAMSSSMKNSRDRNPQRDEFVPGQDDYQRSQNMLVQMVKQFIDLPINVIFTSHIKAEENAEGETVYTAAIHGQQGAVGRQIMGYMNIVGFGKVLDDEKETRRIYFGQHGAYIGKDRFQALGRFRDNLTVPRLEAIVRGTAPAASDSTKKTAAKRPVATTATRKRTA